MQGRKTAQMFVERVGGTSDAGEAGHVGTCLAISQDLGLTWAREAGRSGAVF